MADLGLSPRARLVDACLVGVDPTLMLTGPIDAAARLAERTGPGIADFDVVEINEAFASVVLAWATECRPDMETVNPNGGAIALGHPLGATGAVLLTKALAELERSGGRYGSSPCAAAAASAPAPSSSGYDHRRAGRRRRGVGTPAPGGFAGEPSDQRGIPQPVLTAGFDMEIQARPGRGLGGGRSGRLWGAASVDDDTSFGVGEDGGEHERLAHGAFVDGQPPAQSSPSRRRRPSSLSS
jgi:thiolase-like protein